MHLHYIYSLKVRKEQDVGAKEKRANKSLTFIGLHIFFVLGGCKGTIEPLQRRNRIWESCPFADAAVNSNLMIQIDNTNNFKDSTTSGKGDVYLCA